MHTQQKLVAINPPYGLCGKADGRNVEKKTALLPHYYRPTALKTLSAQRRLA